MAWLQKIREGGCTYNPGSIKLTNKDFLGVGVEIEWESMPRRTLLGASENGNGDVPESCVKTWWYLNLSFLVLMDLIVFKKCCNYSKPDEQQVLMISVIFFPYFWVGPVAGNREGDLPLQGSIPGGCCGNGCCWHPSWFQFALPAFYRISIPNLGSELMIFKPQLSSANGFVHLLHDAAIVQNLTSN